ncbi:hypothetical protein JKP88DRAFT_241273 [Tribonema minus]|uniref:Uncharacterized protein n=1 Tax=Tribonema minus TaxID=303371 RepID=A0A835YYD5_9STRA|nr:hypothetical protein JKP88DRAFT_241273 [Tribonema minus]
MLLRLNHTSIQDTCISVKYDAPIAERESFAGIGNCSRGVVVGYQGEEFGMLVIRGGSRTFAKVVLTGAPTSSGLVSVTVGGRTANIAVASGMSLGVAMAAIRYSTAWNNLNLVASSQCESIEIYTIESEGYPDSLPSIDFGSTGMTGTISLSKQGNTATKDWIPSAQFNDYGFNGLGAIFDPQKWNVFRLRFDAWSSGGIELSLKHPQSIEFVPLHTWRPAAADDRFDTAVPYCTTTRCQTIAATEAPASGLHLAGGSVSSGIPATAGLRARYHRLWLRDAVALSVGGDSLVGVLGSPLMQDGGVRNTGIATIYKLTVVVKSSVDVIAGVMANGIVSAPVTCTRYLPWSALNVADISGTVTVTSGFRYSEAFIAAGNDEVVQVETDQLWCVPGSFVAFTVKPARASDASAIVDSVSFSAEWYET